MTSHPRPIVFDLDGTLYLEGVLLPGARETIQYLKSIQHPFVFLTNNSSKTKETYLQKLSDIGLHIEPNQMVSSLDATLDYLHEQSFKRLVVCATPEVEAVFKDSGFALLSDLDAPGADAVVMTFDTTLTYAKLWLAHEHIRRGAAFIASHPDVVCPRHGGKTMPDVGAFNALLSLSTGQIPTVIGKPEATMVQYLEKLLQRRASDMIMVGDRLYTDMAMAQSSGMVSVCVLTGETTREDIAHAPQSPDVVLDSVADLITALKL